MACFGEGWTTGAAAGRDGPHRHDRRRLKPFLTGDDERGTLAEAARDLGMSEGAVKVAAHRLRARYRAALRDRVAATVASEDEVEEELQHLLRRLSRRDH